MYNIMDCLFAVVIGAAGFCALYLPFVVLIDLRDSKYWSRNREHWIEVCLSNMKWAWHRGYDRGYKDRDAEMGTD